MRPTRKASAGLVVLAVVALLVVLALAVALPFVVRGISSVATQRSQADVLRLSAATKREHPRGAARPVPSAVTVENAEFGLMGAGALVGPQGRFVVTAAHLLMRLDYAQRRVDTVAHLSAVRVSIRSVRSEPLQTRAVSRMWLHKAYSSGMGSERHVDLALLELATPFEPSFSPHEPDYWRTAELAVSEAQHRLGTVATLAVYGARADTLHQVRPDLHQWPHALRQLVVFCGDPNEQLHNNNTFCSASTDSSGMPGCSGDAGAPLVVGNTLVGVVHTHAESPVCAGDTPHGTHHDPWLHAVSVAKLRPWIQAVILGKPFAATLVSSAGLLDTDAVTDDVAPATDVFCAPDGGVYRSDPEDFTFRHCSTGRRYRVRNANELTPCNKPCVLLTVRTTNPSLDVSEETALPVACHAGHPVRLTGRAQGFRVFGSAEEEVIPCGGGLPSWVPTSQLLPCAASLCDAVKPTEMSSLHLQPVCDWNGNAALATGRRNGWLDEQSDFVPVFFEQKLQVYPCHGGVPRWLYQYSTRSCTPEEVARCLGPELVHRAFQGPAAANYFPKHPAHPSTQEEARLVLGGAREELESVVGPDVDDTNVD